MWRWILLVIVALTMGGCGPRSVATGTLEGTVTVGPLTPVQRESEPPPTVPPQVYTSRRLIISSADGGREIARIQFAADGTYQATLPAGRYQVDLQPNGIDRANQLPAAVDIEADQITRLDVSIDTGIR